MNKSYFISIALIGLGVLGFASADARPTKGFIPEEAFEPSRINLDLVPDYVAAYARSGEVAGYIRKDQLFNASGHRRRGRLLVLDESLTRPAGHMVPGRGFVPLGAPEESIPPFEER